MPDTDKELIKALHLYQERAYKATRILEGLMHFVNDVDVSSPAMAEKYTKVTQEAEEFLGIHEGDDDAS